MYMPPNLVEKTFANITKSEIHEKFFSLESFPLYGIHSVEGEGVGGLPVLDL